ncbi:SRPBCC domain-containing protein [Reichenbachiella sp.]|uniref:SRPBCC domain-containing protein n=1 Tax=Reichenbachiella sp. TaxID=2184521 RepID=UPI003B5C7049
MRRFEKQYEVKVSEQLLYEALTNQSKVSQWSGAPAVMSEEEGARFSLWGGSIEGVNKIVTRHTLIQQWKEKSWENYSNVSFEWKQGPSSLVISLVHTAIPDNSYDNIKRGWDEHYMNPLITWLESNNL